MSLTLYEFNDNESPFDSIRHLDEHGNEFWYGRELMPFLEYQSWKRFFETIERAKMACKNSGNVVTSHFDNIVQMQQIGDSQAIRNVITDVKLTRYACYLTAMSGDPRKEAIAKAQTYFAIKTNQAEIADKNTTETVLNSALQLLSDVSSKLETSQSLVIQNQKIIQASFEKISILEEENIRLELANQVNDEVTLKHKLYKSLYNLNALIIAEDYHFPDIDYTVGQILEMFSITTMTETRFANLCSALYWLDYNKKPNEIGVYKYKGKDLIYPSLLLFKQEKYEWFDIKEKFEVDYKVQFPTSNRRYLKEIEGVKQQRLLKEMSIKDHLKESKRLGFYKENN